MSTGWVSLSFIKAGKTGNAEIPNISLKLVRPLVQSSSFSSVSILSMSTTAHSLRGSQDEWLQACWRHLTSWWIKPLSCTNVLYHRAVRTSVVEITVTICSCICREILYFFLLLSEFWQCKRIHGKQLQCWHNRIIRILPCHRTWTCLTWSSNDVLMTFNTFGTHVCARTCFKDWFAISLCLMIVDLLNSFKVQNKVIKFKNLMT